MEVGHVEEDKRAYFLAGMVFEVGGGLTVQGGGFVVDLRMGSRAYG